MEVGARGALRAARPAAAACLAEWQPFTLAHRCTPTTHLSNSLPQDAHQLVEAFARHRASLPWSSVVHSATASSGGASSGHLSSGVSDATNTSGRMDSAGGISLATSGSEGARASTADELATLGAITGEHDRARLARVCRVQRFAVEGSGLRDLSAQLSAAAGVVAPAQKFERWSEISKWLDK